MSGSPSAVLPSGGWDHRVPFPAAVILSPLPPNALWTSQACLLLTGGLCWQINICQISTFNVLSFSISSVKYVSCMWKELGCFDIIFAQILTAHNFCLTRIMAWILIYANALGYFLSIKVEFVMRNMISICLCYCIWEGGLKSATSRKLKKTNKTAYF